jgi:hypothetical protein
LVGDAAFAEHVCRQQVVWLARAARNSDFLQAKTLAMQPWINIGRLLRQGGDIGRALAFFSGIWRAGEDGLIRFGDIAGAPAEFGRTSAELLFVSDTAKAYYDSGRLHEGLKFVRNVARRTKALAVEGWADEVEFQFLLRLERWNSANRVLKRGSWTRGAHELLLNAFYQCVLLALDDTDCSEVANMLTRQARETLAAEKLDHRSVRYALELARFLAHTQATTAAMNLAHRGLEVSARRQDVPLQFGFMALLNDSRRLDFLVKSGYVAMARRHGVEASVPAATADRLAALRKAVIAFFAGNQR